ncbi:MAG: hypothetical protein RLZZ543_1167 [Bacteroidota bacterium]
MRLSWIHSSPIKQAFLLLLLLLWGGTQLHGQAPFGFQRNLTIPGYDLNATDALPNPWAGGFNAPQFNEIELNGDGLIDLIVFERTGNQVLCFLRNTNGNSFRYAPEYQSLFPTIQNWMLLRDFDGDGKEDLFCSGGNGIKIYRNTSSGSNLSSFALQTDLLYSNYGTSSLNLFVSPVDIPAIDDLDNDGDLDIVTFYILGTCVEYHKNLSQELFGHSDSLHFELASSNWGKFTESSVDNSVHLLDSCGRNAGVRHSGSALLLDDIDSDGDQDLLLGDISFPDLKCLINQPQGPTDVIIATPSSYPSAFSNYAVPIFPGAFRIHVNEDNLPDLVIAPNTDLQSLNRARLAKSYLSSAGNFHFTGTETPFLSHEQFDLGRGAYPCFIDNDNDGDLDLLVGNYGEFEPNSDPSLEGNYRASLQLFENTGSNSNPEYRLRNNDLAQLRSLNLQHIAPCAIDLNNDGRTDVVIGQRDGTLLALLKNASGNNYTISNGFVDQLSVDQYAVPTSGDVNNDGLNDLIIGGKSGRLQCFLNSGTSTLAAFPSSPNYSNFGNVETIEESFSNFGYSAPSFFSNSSGSFILSGSESGRLFAWKLDSTSPESAFILLDSNLNSIKDGVWTALTLADLNNDGFPEMIMGSKRGGLSYFNGALPQSITAISLETRQWNVVPNPAKDYFQLSNSEVHFPTDIYVYDISGRLLLQEKWMQKTQTFRCTTLEPGIYLIRLGNGKNSSSKKLIVIP